VIVHFAFHIHPDHKEKTKDELRKLKAVIQKHGGRNLKYYASMTSGTPNRLFMYDIDAFAHFDSLNKDPDYRAIKLDSLYTNATGTIWGEVAL
jgi:quinol monooxygenase YgiN